MVMTAEPDVVEEMEEDIVNAFSFLSDDKGLLTWKGLEEFDEIEELMADGLLAKEELMTMWEEAPKATSSGATPAVDIDGFSVIMRKIDALFEDLDDGDDKDDEENEPDGAASVKAVADAPIVGESGRLRAAFTDIVGAGGAASLADVLRWEDIRSLIDEGQLAVSELRQLWAAAPKASAGDLLNFAGFAAFNTQLDALFEMDDGEGDD
ncbi:unnamed protein product, partial [Phaeothamnion confervicola]